MTEGHVAAIYIYLESGGAGRSVTEASAFAGRGLAGDRYFAGEGTFWKEDKSGQDLTLVEAEAIEAVAAAGIPLELGDSRRNVVTRGINLNDLVGQAFRVGDVECVGVRLCHPCAYLESVTSPGLVKAMVNRGGLRAKIVSSGRITVGDSVVVQVEETASPASSR